MNRQIVGFDFDSRFRIWLESIRSGGRLCLD